jgi:hypothetical protein
MKISETFYGTIRAWTIAAFLILSIILMLCCSFSHPFDMHFRGEDLKDMYNDRKEERKEAYDKAVEKTNEGKELSEKESRDVIDHLTKDTAY